MPKAVPLRMCCACRQSRPKNELFRVVRTPSGEFLADSTGKCAGRGAYVCRSSDCLKRARKSRALERALGCTADIYDALEGMLNE